MTKCLGLLLLASAGISLGLVQAYSVTPTRGQWSDWAPSQFPYNYVSQTLTCNFDSLAYVELFVGDRGANPDLSYKAEVYEPGGVHPVASSDRVTAQQNWAWLKFPLRAQSGYSFTKGKVYEFRFTRAGTDSINYFWQDGDPYRYGDIVVGGEPILGRDLCLRVYGTLNPAPPAFWGMDEWNFVPWSDNDSANRDRLRQECGALARAAGVGTMMTYARWHTQDSLTILQRRSRPDSARWNWLDFDARLWAIAHDAQCRPVINIQGVHKIASSRHAFIKAREPANTDYYLVWDTATYCAPRGLWKPLYSEENSWSRYIRELVTHLEQDTQRRRWPGPPCSTVHVWEIWNEPNDTCIRSERYIEDFVTGWWRRPTIEYTSGFDGLRGLCSLYVQMAWVAAKVIRDQPGHQHDTIVIGSTNRAFYPRPVDDACSGIDFIRTCYQIAAADTTKGIFWDGVSFHPYQSHFGFDPEDFAAQAESVLAVAREFGDFDCLLWNSECGLVNYDWRNISDINRHYQTDATQYLPQIYTSALASQASPGARYYACQWWWFSNTDTASNYGLVCLRNFYPDSTGTGRWETLPSYNEFGRLTRALSGLRFERRVLAGDIAQDTGFRMYEFSNPAQDNRRTWVGWAVDSKGRTPKTVAARFPVRTDSVILGTLGAAHGAAPADPDGWLRLTLSAQTMQVDEYAGQPVRPDFVVDSVRVRPLRPQVNRPCTLLAYVRDHGTRNRPGIRPLVRFGWDEDSVATVPMDTSHDAGPVRFVIAAVPPAMHGIRLFTALVNPKQEFVELGMDDNTGYQKTRVVRPPEGSIAIASHDSRHKLPIVPVRLRTESRERDTTGNTPADSARLIQVLVSNADSVLATDTGAWFSGAVRDTTLRFLLGQGRYRILFQVRDSGDNYSLPIADTLHPTILFDSTSATGTLELYIGQRFSTMQQYTLSLSATNRLSDRWIVRLGHEAQLWQALYDLPVSTQELFPANDIPQSLICEEREQDEQSAAGMRFTDEMTGLNIPHRPVIVVYLKVHNDKGPGSDRST